MAESRINMEQIERAISHRFGIWTNFFREKQASPILCIGVGHVGEKRSEPEPVLCIPQDIDLPWAIEALEATLHVFKAEQSRRGATDIPGLIIPPHNGER